MDEWTTEERETRTSENNPALASLDALVAERDEARRIADGMARAPYGEFETMRKRAEAAEAERDEYRAANESVAVCAAHTTEVIRGNCLVCAVEEANTRAEAAEAEVERLAMQMYEECVPKNEANERIAREQEIARGWVREERARAEVAETERDEARAKVERLTARGIEGGIEDVCFSLEAAEAEVKRLREAVQTVVDAWPSYDHVAAEEAAAEMHAGTQLGALLRCRAALAPKETP